MANHAMQMQYSYCTNPPNNALKCSSHYHVLSNHTRCCLLIHILQLAITHLPYPHPFNMMRTAAARSPFF